MKVSLRTKTNESKSYSSAALLKDSTALSAAPSSTPLAKTLSEMNGPNQKPIEEEDKDSKEKSHSSKKTLRSSRSRKGRSQRKHHSSRKSFDNLTSSKSKKDSKRELARHSSSITTFSNAFHSLARLLEDIDVTFIIMVKEECLKTATLKLEKYFDGGSDAIEEQQALLLQERMQDFIKKDCKGICQALRFLLSFIK